MRTRPYVLRTRSLRSHHLVPGCRPLRMRFEGCACASPVLLIYCSNAAQMGSFWTPLRPLFSCFFRVTRPVRGLQKTHGKSGMDAGQNGQKWAKPGYNLDFDGFIYYPNKNDHVQWKKNHYIFLTKKNHFFRTKKSDFEQISGAF